MDITVKNLYVRVSPRKVRPVLYGLRGENAETAATKLSFTRKKAAVKLAALVRSAIAAAKESDLDTAKLIIKAVFCNEAPRLKRRRFESKGRAARITKKNSHLVLTISDQPLVINTKTVKTKDAEKQKAAA